MTIQNPAKWSKFLTVFLFLSQFNFINVTQSPSTACVGDSISVSCVLILPDDGVRFTSVVPRFLVGDSDTEITVNDINNNITHPGVDLTRMTASVSVDGNDARVSGSIILNSFLTSDEGLRLGCFTEYFESGTNNLKELTKTFQLNQSVPPSAPSLQSSVSNFNTATCSADISLSWNTPPSNRTVDRYFLYLDGSPLGTTNSNSYIHSTILNVNTDYQYSVTAMSCAGNSTNSSTNVNYVATPPSAPSLQSSVSNFNTATCSADIFLSWNTSPSDRTVDRYFLYLDGSPLATTNSNSYIHSTILNINTGYQYSVTAMSCAGNSTNNSSNVDFVLSYSLDNSSQYMCLDYNNAARTLKVNWGLSTPTQPSGVSGLDITYFLQLLYSHSRQGVTYTYTDSTGFTLPSSQLSYNTVLTAHNFTQLDGVETNITANLMIVQQCGQSFCGTAMECFLKSNNPVILPTPSILPSTSTEMSSTAVPCNTVSISSSSTLLSTSIIFALLFLISLVINLILIIVILLQRRNEQSNSPPKPAPSHPYEYIDLDKMSGNISSPTQQQSPQDYVHMSSVSKQDTTQPPTHYANLK